MRDYDAEAQEYADNYNPEGERREDCFHERNVLMLLCDWTYAAWRVLRAALCDPSGEQR